MSDKAVAQGAEQRLAGQAAMQPWSALQPTLHSPFGACLREATVLSLAGEATIFGC